mmetsp:Transcript_58921/g.164636  ORF Transcript_58921/g.164636 Transcript_58921/m.164636 type:complete len:208 (-) Transcript_58921:63-686(-)|eukprot:CAMPEP_0117572598 /NCGR_PEP_ID=MMETSP0784-20121206/60442_1 /TAXON_ID=39447 /ORGANISM="" /LENGTH=207 /DNA_ID=CAMNT_0005370979 /DNA_START=19 /DNA_END=642 /DNA_ORIENTATION=-
MASLHANPDSAGSLRQSAPGARPPRQESMPAGDLGRQLPGPALVGRRALGYAPVGLAHDDVGPQGGLPGWRILALIESKGMDIWRSLRDCIRPAADEDAWTDAADELNTRRRDHAWHVQCVASAIKGDHLNRIGLLAALHSFADDSDVKGLSASQLSAMFYFADAQAEGRGFIERLRRNEQLGDGDDAVASYEALMECFAEYCQIAN